MCSLWVLVSIKVAVMEPGGCQAHGGMGGGVSISGASCKSVGPRGLLYVTQLCISERYAAHTGQPFEMSAR